jgi:hypothetical protein
LYNCEMGTGRSGNIVNLLNNNNKIILSDEFPKNLEGSFCYPIKVLSRPLSGETEGNHFRVLGSSKFRFKFRALPLQ